MAHQSNSDDSVRAEAGNNSIDDQTIFSTPVPMVASTVSRNMAHGLPVHGDMGSFLDQSSTLTSLPNIPVVDDVWLRPPSYHQQSSSSDCNSSASTIRQVDCHPVDGENGVEMSNSRSSLGILSLDNMAELGSSMLYYEGIPAQVSEMSPNISQSAGVSSIHKSQTLSWLQHHVETPGQTLTPDELDQVAERLRRDLSQAGDGFVHRHVVPPVNTIDRGRHTEHEAVVDGINGALFRAFGQSGGEEEDGDTTVHEVCLDDEELMRFDEEFSDFDVTVTSNGDDNQLYFEDDRCQQPGFTGYLPHSAYEHRAGSCDNTRGQRSAAAGQGSDGGDSGQHLQGEGQNLDDVDQAHVPNPPDRLDSMYFQQKPCLPHEGGDGEEEREHSPWRGVAGRNMSSLFANKGDEEGSDHNSHTSQPELDTLGMDAIRREMESYLASDDESDAGSRPDLEGTNTDEVESSERQAGEGGTMSSPVPGNGGDGSSGHGSDVLLSSLSPPPVLPLGGEVDTSDMMRGLGYLLGGLSEDTTLLDATGHLEGQERQRPMGDDILGETSRHVTFSNTTDIRNRTLSGTSLEDDTLPQQEEDQSDINGEDQHLASVFLKATSSGLLDDTLQTSDTTWSQSTFNLGDLCPASDVSVCKSEWQNSQGGSLDALPRVNEGVTWQSQAAPSSGGRLWETAGGNWMDMEDVWNLSHTTWDTEQQTNTGSIDDDKAFEGSDGFSDEFLSSEQALAMLEQDKEEFFEEHIVDQEDAVVSPSSTNKLPQGWSIHSELNMTQPSWMSEQGDTDQRRRVSIGTFMASRTEVLGGISGTVLADSRPTFGSKIVTPPDSHTPRSLLPHGLSDLSGEGGSCVASDDIRGCGVGSDIGDVEDTSRLCIEELCDSLDHQSSAHTNGRGSTLTGSSFPDSHHDVHSCLDKDETSRKSIMSAGRPDQKNEQRDVVDGKTYRVAAPILVDRSAGDSHILASLDLDESSFLNVSTISKLITSSASNMKADDLVRQILHASSAKTHPKQTRSCPKDECNPHKTNGVVHSASVDSVHPRGITEMPQREQRLSAQVQKTHSSEPSLDGPDKRERVEVKRRSGATRLPTYQRPTVSSSGRQEECGKTRQDRSGKTRQEECGKTRQDRSEKTRQEECGKTRQNGSLKGELGKQRRHHNARVDESSSSETSPREEAGSLAGRRRGKTGEKASETRSVESAGRVTDHALDYKTRQPVQDSSGTERVNASGVKQTAVKDKPSPQQSKRVTEHTKEFDGGERGKQNCVNDGRLSRERVNASSTKPGVGLNEESLKPSQHGDNADMVTQDGSRVRDERERSPDEGDSPERMNRDGSRQWNDTRQGVYTSPSGATKSDWRSPRASLAKSLRLGQSQRGGRDGVEVSGIGACHSDDISRGDTVIADTISNVRANGGPVESFHHNLLPPDQQRASVVMLPCSGGVRPALLTGQALASTPFAAQYLDDITSMTGLTDHVPGHVTGHVYSDSSESESVLQVPLLSRLSSDEFTCLPMSRLSIDSQCESSSTEVDMMFTTRMHHGNGRGVCVAVPSEIHLPGACCVGLSSHVFLPIHNHTSHWLHTSLNVAAVSVDGRSWQVAARAVPFIVKDKVYIEPQSTENVKVIFAPSEPGVYVLELHLVASLIVSDTPMQAENALKVVNILGLAETPQIQVTGSSAGVVDFGAIPWGCEKCQFVTLVNRGRANVPIRLVISSKKSTWSCFTFGKCGAADVSLITNRSLPSMPSLAPSVHNCMLYGIGSMDSGGQAVTVPIFFRGPSRQADRTSARVGPPVNYLACVNIEVDTPSTPVTLGTLLLKATAGTVRLHVPRDIDGSHVVQFRSEFGECQTRFIPLRNAGNIPLDVSLEVSDWSDLFVVRPAQLTIRPAGEAQVMVRFEPKDNVTATFESLLLMFVEPDGKAYEIPLYCAVIPPLRSVTPTRHGLCHTPCVYSNKHYLNWGGVPIGKTMEQSTILRNKAQHTIKLTIAIRRTGSIGQDFQLWSVEGIRQMLEVTLRPNEEFAVHVVFAPSAVREYRATMKVRQYQPDNKYTIPLSGYGGVSHIVLDNLQSSQKTHYWTNVGLVTASQHVLTKVTVRNVGVRAAYISGICFQDMGCKRRLPESRMSIQPCRFCLQAKQTQNVVVRLFATEAEASLCQAQAGMVAAVSFFYSDRLSTSPNKDEMTQAGGDAVHGVHFDLPNHDKLLIDRDSRIQMRNTVTSHCSIRKVMLALIGESAPSSTPEPLLSCPLSDLKKPGHRGSMFGDDGHTGRVPQLDRDSHGVEVQQKLSVDKMKVTWQNTTSEDGTGVRVHRQQWWTIRPTQVILQTTFQHEEPVIEKVQLSNYSDRVLCYEFSWPAHCVTVTQERGVIDPRSMVHLLISANTNVRSKGIELPWHGEISITCDGQQERLQVQIQDEVRSFDDAVSHRQFTEPRTPLLTVTPPSPLSRGGIESSTQYIKFPQTIVGKTSEQTFHLGNSNAYPIRWTLTSVAPPYRKREDNGEVYRVIYAAFWLPRQTGLLHPEQDTQVYIDFCPREAGVYSQYWEVKCEDQVAPSPILTTYKVEMTGTACPDPSDHSCRPEDGRGRHRVGGSIQVKEKLVTFQDVTPHQTATLKVKILNKNTESTTVTVMSPLAPFFISRSTVHISGRHYTSLPVEFRADSPGHYQGVLLLKTQLEDIHVVLIGRCT